jgi:ribose 5-phosphate isomerase B
MKIAIASDHRGYDAKQKLIPMLRRLGHACQDFGCDGTAAVDYPDYAAPAARAVSNGQCEVGILIEGSGIGMTIVSNKVAGVRAALVNDDVTARRAREHHHCNVLCLGADLLSDEQLRNIVEIFLNTKPEDGRHARRIAKIQALERECALNNGQPVNMSR